MVYQVLAFGQLPVTVPERGVVGVTWPILEFYTPWNIFGMAKGTDFNFVHGLATRSTNLQMNSCPLSGRGQSHVTHSRILHPLKYLWNGWS